MPKADFEAWVKTVQDRHHPLDTNSYARLARPSVRNAVVEYAPVKPGLFESVMNKYVQIGALTTGTTPR